MISIVKLFIVVVPEFTRKALVYDKSTTENVTAEYVDVATAGSIVSELEMFTVKDSSVTFPAISFTFSAVVQ